MSLIDEYKDELTSLRSAIMKLTADPTTSQSVSSANGGSFSASFADLAKLHARERELISLIAEISRAQSGGGCFGITYPIYCGG